MRRRIIAVHAVIGPSTGTLRLDQGGMWGGSTSTRHDAVARTVRPTLLMLNCALGRLGLQTGGKHSSDEIPGYEADSRIVGTDQVARIHSNPP